MGSQTPVDNWISNSNTDKQNDNKTCTNSLPLKHTIYMYYPKMNDTMDMDSTIAGPINVRS
jgi:hypothetical protein